MNVTSVPGASPRAVPREHLLGTYAGAVSRLVGYAIDIGIVTASFAIGASIVEWLVSTVFPVELDLGDTPVAAGIALTVWAFFYFTYARATTGRTIGKALIGTRVVRADGSDLRAGRAALRVLVMPLSFLLLGIGLLLILLRKDRRALHDLIADTAEVYYWMR